MEHGARSRSGSFFNFNGTAGVWRRCAIDDAGGWQHDTLTEDTDLSYRAQLRRLEISLPAGHRVRLRAARGNERLQGAAGALGQGPDADGEKNSAARAALGRARAGQGRSRLPPHRQHQLSVHGGSLDAAAAGHDRAFLSGLVPDAVHRPAAVHRVELLDFRFLSRVAARPLSEDLEALDPLHAVRDGRRHRPLGAQRQGRARSASSA